MRTRRSIAILSSLMFLGLTGQAAAEESGWVLAPFMKDGWNPNFTVAASSGSLNPAGNLGNTGTYTGLEVSLDCPWFSPPKGRLRQQFWLGRFDNGTVKFTSFELNPRWYMPISDSKKWELGVGPGIGYMNADTSLSKGIEMGTFQIGADLNYRNGAFFFGLGWRWQDARDTQLLPDNRSGVDNTLAVVKIGVNF